MYESLFRLHARPFLASPIAERYFPASSIEHARETVLRCLERGAGPAVILGSAGTGKSTLCQVLARQLRDRFRVATLASARLCTRRALLQNILFELKQPYRDRDEGELRLSLIDFLQPSESCPHGMLLIVDEAHVLPLRLLEEIRMLTNLVCDDQPRVRLVLAASLTLDERLASPRLESFNQRIAARCYLQSMQRDETAQYVRAQIAAVGGEPDEVFTHDALQAIYRATDGIPRLVNQLCDHVLIMAALGRRARVDAAGVEEAWADLQQLPAPWTARDLQAPSEVSGGGLLEFGPLDDAPEAGSLDLACDTDAAPLVSEPVVGSVDAHVTARLEQLESGLSAIAGESAMVGELEERPHEEQQFRPFFGQRPEIELVIHGAHDPFSERFDQEEVVVDPFSSLTPLSGLFDIAPIQESGEETIPFRAPAASADATNSVPDEPSLGPESAARVTPEYSVSEVADEVPSDDRDLLEIHDESAESQRTCGVMVTSQPARRREYRQLFAHLRRR